VITVTRLTTTPVKSTRLRSAESLALDRDGALGNRRFYVIDDRGRMVNAKQLGELVSVFSDYHPDDRRLALTFPGGEVVEGVVTHGATVQTRFFSRSSEARLVEGPWSAALSTHCGRSLRLVEADGDGRAVDRGRAGAATLISRASLERLASAGGVRDVDERRFRMLIEIDGVDAHAEDAWVGRRTRVGAAVIAWGGHVGRCLITSRDPETGKIDLPTLDILREYRGHSGTTEPLPFGIYGAVMEPGTVRVGDPVTLL
jgi:MOSC domain-containing protein